MKPLHTVVALSLAANIGLVAYVWRMSATGGARPASPSETTKAPLSGGATPGRSTVAAPPTAAQSAAMEEIWSEHAYEDPPAMLARLRAAGISPAQMRAFMASRVRRPPAPVSAAERPAPRPPAADRPAVSAARQERSLYDLKRYGDLPREKINQVKLIEADYEDLTRSIRTQASGTLLPEDREKLLYVERETRADLARVLTPAELDDYLIRTSPAASGLTYLRDQAVGFHASEEEYRAIVLATIAADMRFGVSYLASTPADTWLKRQQSVLDQLGKVFSPERLAEYQQASDPAHRALDALATRLELPATTSNQVLALQIDVQRRIAFIQVATLRDPPARAAQLASLADEVNRNLTNLLTPRGIDAYLSSSSGLWLRPLLPASPAPPKS